MSYYFSKTLAVPFEEAEAQVIEELKKEGFGVLTQIDVKETIKKKLNEDFRKYKILGACNPPFAYRALQAEDKIGLLMPCNVVVQEIADNKVEVAAIDVEVSMRTVNNPGLHEIGKEVRLKLKKVIDSL
jgi:uncharacterized protein (DUF302 family)